MVMERKKNDKRKYELVEDLNKKEEIFEDLYTYIRYLFKFLWSQPKVVTNILLKSNIKDVKDYLAHFFVNNMYEDILSSKNKEEQLLYIITSLLKKEINNLDIDCKNINTNNIENIFLNNTPCGFIFQELSYKKDIQAFFKIIIIDLVEKLELSFPSQEIVFDPGRIKDTIFLSRKEEEKDSINKDRKDLLFFKKIFENDIEKKIKMFDEKYQFGLPKEELEIILDNNKVNKNMYDYINKKIKQCSNIPDLYSTVILLDNINFAKTNSNTIDQQFTDDDRNLLSKNIKTIYKQSFFETISIIDKLLENLIININILPYSIKCISKIISILITKKYPDLSTFEINIFISIFFFKKLFIPIFINPAISALINDFIISDNTIKNITIIISIFNKFISGQFYKDIKEEGIFTPFNWYFLNKMPFLLEFFEKSKNVKLPRYIEKIINKEENEYDYNYEFDYFENNEDKMMFIRNICFSFDDFYYLYYNIKNNFNEIFKIKSEKTNKVEKAIGKLINYEYKIENIKNKLNKNKQENINIINDTKNLKKKNTLEKEIEEKPKLEFFLISELIFNDKYKKLFNMESKKEYFNIKELKNPESNENIIIKAKNFICDFLYNFHSLDDIDLDINIKNKLNTMNLFKELKKYLKSSDLLKDEKIPSQWYLNSIIEYLKKIPENLVENDYNELYNQIENDINNSIKLLSFEKVSLFADKIKLAKKSHIFYNKAKKIMIDIDLNRQVHDILEKEIIPVQIEFNYIDKEKIFEISPYFVYNGVREKLHRYFSSNKNNKKKCQTIKQFTNIFPNIVEFNERQDLDVFEILEELNIPKKLLKYFDYIGDSLKQLEKVNEKKFKDIKIKIYDYVMEKLYDKIFPSELQQKDITIYQNCVKCSWVELKHFVKGKNDYILENFVPDTINNFEQINKEKSPRKKLKCVNNIFKCIYNLAQLNGDMIESTDDSLPILNYVLIKARPENIYSNCIFMKLFLGDKKNKAEGHQLSQLIGICIQISEISASSLFDITDKEFKENCLLASKEEFSKTN